MAEPLPVTYGPANWTDWTDNWRKLDGDFLQYRGILRYATDAGKPASGQPGQVIFTADNSLLNMWTTKWVQVLSSENMKLVTSGAQARFTHPGASGAGLLFTASPNLITSEVDFKGGRVEADTLVIFTAGGSNRTARLTTTAPDLVSDSPILAPSLTLNASAANVALNVSAGKTTLTGPVTLGSTLSVMGGTISTTTVLLSGVQSTATNAATRKDYVDGQIDTCVALTGSTMTGSLVAPYLFFSAAQYNAAHAAVRKDYVDTNFLKLTGGTLSSAVYIHENTAGQNHCFRLQSSADNPYMDFYNHANNGRFGYIQGSSNSMMFYGDGCGYLQLTNVGAHLRSPGDILFEPDNIMSGFMSTTAFIWGKAASDLANAGIEMFGAGSSAEGSVRSTITATTQNYYARHDGAANVNGCHFMSFYRGSTQIGSISQNGTTGTAYNVTSDRRAKTIIGPVTDALDRLMKLKTYRVTWNADPLHIETDALIADEVMKIVPEAVTGEPNAVYNAHEAEMLGVVEGSDKHQGMDRATLVPLLIASVQELTGRVAELEGAA